MAKFTVEVNLVLSTQIIGAPGQKWENRKMVVSANISGSKNIHSLGAGTSVAGYFEAKSTSQAHSKEIQKKSTGVALNLVTKFRVSKK